MSRRSHKAQQARKVNGSGRITRLHEQFVSRVLDVPVYTHNGPDLFDDGATFLEVKFSLVHNEYTGPVSWTVLGHQMAYDSLFSGNGFWALGKYTLAIPCEQVRDTMDDAYLESQITSRELYVVPWKWMEQFQVSHTGSGEYRYAKSRQLPSIKESYTVAKGTVHIMQGVPNYYFSNIWY